MINAENLNGLYNGVIENKELTTQELYSYGFTSKDLSDLINQGKLERIKRGVYKFISFEDLYQFGNDLNKEKNYENSFKCFTKCYEMNSTHQDTALQLFLSYIIKKDYENAFKILEDLEKSTKPSDIADFNLYLYLLNIITEVPDKYKDYAKYIRYEDIKLNDNVKDDKVVEHNKIRNSLLKGKIFFAMSKLKELISNNGINPKILIIKHLIGQVIGLENSCKRTILEALNNKDYDKIISVLENKQKRQVLNKYDVYVLELAKTFLDIKNNGYIPPRIVSVADDFFKAVDEKSYERALHLYKEYAQKCNLDLQESSFYLLLEDICTLIRKIKFPEEEIIENVDNEVVTIQLKESKEEKNTSIKFSDIVTFLMKGDLENSFRFLRQYLCSINRLDYEFLIVNLIKLSLIENDFAFTKPMLALTYISKDNYEFDISTYIQEFYIKLSQNKFEEVRIYLDIISKANILGQAFILTDSLLKVLENSEKLANYKRDNKILDSAEDAYVNSQQYVEPVIELPNKPEENSEKVETIIEKPKTLAFNTISKSPKITSLETVIDDDRSLIKSKYDLLVSNGMILLKPMSDERINNLLKIIKEYDDIDAFIINDQNSNQLVLRYKCLNHEFIDYKQYRIKGKDAYLKKNYLECIKIYSELLQCGKPQPSVYAYIGLSYMKLFDVDKAIDYLKVATFLSKKENGIYDFTDLISSLTGSVDKEDKKTYIRMDDKDFVDSNDNFGLGDITYVTEYIYNSGLDVETACKQLQLNKEEIIILMLVYARDFYKQGEFEKGNQFLKYVEKVKNKSSHINKIFSEVRTNKKFYRNRVSESDTSLALTLHPKK